MTTKRKKAPAKRRAAKRFHARLGPVDHSRTVKERIGTALETRTSTMVNSGDGRGWPELAREEVARIEAGMNRADVGLGEVRLTHREERVLAETPRHSDIQVKPDGSVYMPHPAITRWFNRAFGRLRWAIVMQASPVKAGPRINCAFTLYVHGKAVANAIGEQDFLDSDMTYGESVESTYGSGLRRLAKRIGVGLELWSKKWTDEFLAERCVCVETPRGLEWRRKDARPFDGERKRGKGKMSSTAKFREVKRITTTGRDGHGRGQLGRLHQIAKNAGRSHDDIKAYIAGRYGLKSTKDITTDIYDNIVAALEAPGPLEMTRQPGEEG
jgi:hypothetical protein